MSESGDDAFSMESLACRCSHEAVRWLGAVGWLLVAAAAVVDDDGDVRFCLRGR